MPFSLRSTSFCFLACLCSYSYGLAGSPLILPPDVTIPFKGDVICLNGDCAFVNIYAGAEQGSIISSNGQDLTITGQNHELSFTDSQGPVLKDYAFISAEESVTLRDFSTLMFSKNVSSGEKGMISGKTVSISGVDRVIFWDNSVRYSPLASITGQPPAPAPTTSDALKGSIFGVETSVEISRIQKELLFDNNSGNFGTVCHSGPQGNTTFTVKECKGKIAFTDNTASCGGGVIYKGDVLFQDNEGAILFRGNAANDDLGILAVTQPTPADVGGGGGAICAPDKTVTFKGNKGPITFDYNFAKGRGGVVQTQTFTLIADNAVFFSNNTAEKGGGAIYAPTVDISTNGGAILFERNRAAEGGAICVSAPTNNPPNNGKLTLNAADGDMIFSGNMTNDRPGERNAIRILDNGTAVSLNASGLSKLVFHDPVVQNNPTTTPPPTPTTSGTVTINDSGSGSVVFTAESLTPSEN